MKSIRMGRYRLDSIAQLARQMEFAPHEVRTAQVTSAEALLLMVEPAKAYPSDFVVFKITGYRPKEASPELFTGLALQHDLGLLVEIVSDSLDLHTAHFPEPVLSIEDACEKFNVSSKTIQRWRRKGLPARRFIYPDGKRRVGFLLNRVERFVAAHADQVVAASNFSQVDSSERDQIVRRARHLATECGCCENEITRRVARHLNRSPLTVLHTIRKYDTEYPADAVFPRAADPISDADRAVVVRAYRRGVPLRQLCRRYDRPRSAIYRVILDDRAHRLLKRKGRFYDDPIYHQPDAEHAVQAVVAESQLELPEAPKREESRLPRDLPPYLQDLYRTPLLTKSQERSLFLKLNFHKYQFVTARRRLDPERLRHRDLTLLESHLRRASEAKNAIVRANLRLVVSVARRHVRPNVNLLELASEGNLILMRAVDGFDLHRGHRFSTYATLALMKGFARAVPQMLAADRRATHDEFTLTNLPDRRESYTLDRRLQREEVNHLLSRLSDRERLVLSAHFGLDDAPEPSTYEQLGRRLNLSKERIRQIEQAALDKLRAAARTH